MPPIERDIVRLIGTKGPRTGFEIKKEIDEDNLLIWKTCRHSRSLQVQTVGKRYLRLDRHVKGFARLSPSILREFLTYSIIGLKDRPDLLEKRCIELSARIHEISRFKLELAQKMVSDVMQEFDDGISKRHQICFIIAGDIVYNMAHDVPRPERSTGKIVMGSDIDLIVAVDDHFPDTYINKLDDLIYQKKYRMLITPAIREEVDYKIKRLSLIRDQACFDDFKRMVAIKILQEGLLLYGNQLLFDTIKTIIEENGLSKKLDEFERAAEMLRNKAEKLILDNRLDKEKIMDLHLFYSAEEFEEFE
ncbi:MAG: hypothetical protein OS130_11780 [Thermodesulfobacteriota bacterium]|nr:MAG: hypothetical protein OS130_11780 [Thermodesulfobacteriota bacterium]